MTQQTQKPLIFFRFEDLRVYHKALDYSIWVIGNLNVSPSEPSASLVGRFHETSRLIAVHIAEGSAYQKPHFIAQLRLAKTASRECLVLTSLAARLGLINEIQENDSRNQLTEMTKMLGALITSLQRNPDPIEESQEVNN